MVDRAAGSVGGGGCVWGKNSALPLGRLFLWMPLVLGGRLAAAKKGGWLHLGQ